MKKIFLFSITTTLLGTLFFTSCSKGDEVQPASSNNNPNEKFHGSWSVSENSKLYGSNTYNLSITDSSDLKHILFSYLYGYHTKISATVTTNSFTIATQIIEGNNVSGTGTLTNAKQINMTYFVNTGFDYDTITAVLTK